MLYTDHLRTPSLKNCIDKLTFSFVDEFSYEKQEQTIANSISKSSDNETNSCCTCEIGTEREKQQREQFFYQEQQKYQESDKQISLAYGLVISRQINYSSSQQYKQRVQNLLKDLKMSEQNKIYLRLIIVDKQVLIDSRLEWYLQQAMDIYRSYKESLYG